MKMHALALDLILFVAVRGLAASMPYPLPHARSGFDSLGRKNLEEKEKTHARRGKHNKCSVLHP
jgi:hypothetical protein